MPLRLVSNSKTKYNFRINTVVNTLMPDIVDSNNNTRYYLVNGPQGISLNDTTRALTGTPSRRERNIYQYLVIKGNEASVFDIEISIYQTDSDKLDDRHDLKFFKYPINYNNPIRNKLTNSNGNNVPDIADNNYSTSETSLVYWINTRKEVDSTGTDNTGSKITHLFLKTNNITGFTITGMGITGTHSKTIASDETVVNWEGKATRIDSDNTQNYLYTFDPVQTNIRDIIITFTGSNIQIYEIAVLEEILSLNANGQFSEISYSMQDFGSILKKDLAERVTKIGRSGQPRWSWQIEYTALMQSQNVNSIDKEKDIYNKILNFIRDRTNNNFFCTCEYTRYPSRCFPATFPNTEIGIAYLSDRYTGSGETISFSILES